MHSSRLNFLSVTLVGVQFACIGAYLSLLRAFPWRWWSIVALALAAMIGAAALLANRPGNFNIRPDPKPGARLIRHGIYSHIRHPMYTSLLLAGLAITVAVPATPAILLWCVLLATLIAKASLEERWMKAMHPEYAEYMQHTKRFVPWLW